MKVPQISIIRFLNFGLKNEHEKQNILSFRYVLFIKKKYFEKKKKMPFLEGKRLKLFSVQSR